jgi:hypothetical protein
VQEVVELRAPRDTSAPDEAKSVLDMSHGGDVTMTWHDPQQLEIVYAAWAEVLRGCHLAHGIAIQFTARATPDPAWSDAARIEWKGVHQMEQDLARRGKPSVHGDDSGLVGTCP